MNIKCKIHLSKDLTKKITYELENGTLKLDGQVGNNNKIEGFEYLKLKD